MIENPTERFLSRLETLGGLKEAKNPDRAALAALRRVLSQWPAAPPEAMRIVTPFLPEHVDQWREHVYYLIAALFALHPCTTEGGQKRGFGAALREAGRGESGQGAERRLLAILGARAEDLPSHLRHMVAYLRARDVRVDYRQLMRDLLWWEKGNGDVQRRWGRQFWGAAMEQNEEEKERKEEQ